jgi:hypothetical protein
MRTLAAGLLATTLAAAPPVAAYPLYGSEDSGIRRLEEARLSHEGQLPGGRQRVSGELLHIDQVEPRLRDRADFELPVADGELSTRIRGLLGAEASRYSVAVLDLSDPGAPLYAEHNGNEIRNPGSVGKVMVAVALFQALADAWPGDVERRRAILRDTRVVADEFIISDGHTVRLWDPENRRLTRRPLQVGDEGSLYDFVDWMMSASSNAAAATVMKHAMLLAHFGAEYPVSEETGRSFFAQTPKPELARLYLRTFVDALARNGLDVERIRQGSFFTRTGKAKVPGVTSYATTRELTRLLLRMEQGRLVDSFSSRELKRLLYVTERRIRYASSPALHEAAVYFKSGSWFGCEPEEGFVCRKYEGNVRNLMNSVGVIEAPAGAPRLYYLVSLTSNVLRKNSAVDHQSLATRIHRLIEQRHGLR